MITDLIMIAARAKIYTWKYESNISDQPFIIAKNHIICQTS
jgi:hypothetical protein